MLNRVAHLNTGLVQYFDIATIRLDSDGLVVAASTGATSGGGGGYSFAIHDGMFNHYYHTVETLLLLFSISRECFDGKDPDRLYLGSRPWNNPKQDNLQQQLLEIIFPTTEIIGSLRMEMTADINLVFVDRGRGRDGLGKMLNSVQALCAQWAPEFRSTVLQSVTKGQPGLTPATEVDRPASAILRAGYVTRPPPAQPFGADTGAPHCHFV